MLLAILKGELLPGADRVSLSTASCSSSRPRGQRQVFDAGSQARITVNQWLLDPVLAWSLRSPRCMVLRSKLSVLADRSDPGLPARLHAAAGLPAGALRVGLLPFAALVVPGAVEVSIGRARERAAGRLAQTVATGWRPCGRRVAAPMWGPPRLPVCCCPIRTNRWARPRP